MNILWNVCRQYKEVGGEERERDGEKDGDRERDEEKDGGEKERRRERARKTAAALTHMPNHWMSVS